MMDQERHPNPCTGTFKSGFRVTPPNDPVGEFLSLSPSAQQREAYLLDPVFQAKQAASGVVLKSSPNQPRVRQICFPQPPPEGGSVALGGPAVGLYLRSARFRIAQD